MPAGLSCAEAAALGVNHLTAWRMLHGKARTKAGDTVLIFDIAGGIALAARQIARLAGARTLVTSRDPDRLRRALTLRAAVAVDGRGDIVGQVTAATGSRGVDVVAEHVGEAVWSAALKSLVRGGRLVTCGATTDDQPSSDIRRIFNRHLPFLGLTLCNLSEFRCLAAPVQRCGLKPVMEQGQARRAEGTLQALSSRERLRVSLRRQPLARCLPELRRRKAGVLAKEPAEVGVVGKAE